MVTNSKLSACKSEILDLISSIPDPEIPCITISDLGIIRGVKSTIRDSSAVNSDLLWLPRCLCQKLL